MRSPLDSLVEMTSQGSVVPNNVQEDFDFAYSFG